MPIKVDLLGQVKRTVVPKVGAADVAVTG